MGISGLVVEYIVAIDVTRVRFPADAFFVATGLAGGKKCRDPGSNRGPSDLQSDALPTELSRLRRHFATV